MKIHACTLIATQSWVLEVHMNLPFNSKSIIQIKRALLFCDWLPSAGILSQFVPCLLLFYFILFYFFKKREGWRIFQLLIITADAGPPMVGPWTRIWQRKISQFYNIFPIWEFPYFIILILSNYSSFSSTLLT
jgi:hypothetical protein